MLSSGHQGLRTTSKMSRTISYSPPGIVQTAFHRQTPSFVFLSHPKERKCLFFFFFPLWQHCCWTLVKPLYCIRHLEKIKHQQNKKDDLSTPAKCEPKDTHNQVLCKVDMANLCLLASWPNFTPRSYLISRIERVNDAVNHCGTFRGRKSRWDNGQISKHRVLSSEYHLSDW